MLFRSKDFVINVSHELRTPLASIQGYTETLLDGAIDDPQHNVRFLQIIRQNAERIGYPKNFTILDQSDQVDTVRGILRHIKVDDRKFDPMTILFEIGQAKNRFLSGAEAVEHFLGNKRLGSEYGEIIASVYPKYLEQLRALGAMDFDDLLFRCVELLEKNDDVQIGRAHV